MLALALIGLVVLTYRASWHAGFVWDDDVMLTANPVVQAPDGLADVWASTRLPDYFPLTSTVFWAGWQLWGDWPLPYHLLNVALHAAGAVLLWRSFRRLGLHHPWFAAALFAVHPVAVESVAWITELKNTLSFALGVTAFWAYLRAASVDPRNARWRSQSPVAASASEWYALRVPGIPGWYAASLVAYVAALLAKTSVVPLPAVLLIVAWWQRGRIGVRDLVRVAPFFAAAAVLAGVGMWFQANRAIGEAMVRDDGLLSRVLLGGRAIWFYAGKAAWPAEVSFVYPRWALPAGWVDAVAAVLAVGVLVALWLLRHRFAAPRYARPEGADSAGDAARGRAPFALALAYVALLSPTLGLVNVGYMRFSLVADRWQYLALPIALAGVVQLAGMALAHQGMAVRRIASALAAGLLVALSGVSAESTGRFQNRETLWAMTLRQNPESALARTEWAIELLQGGNRTAAVRELRTALARDPAYESAHYNLGFALLGAAETVEAAEHFRRALALQPDFTPAHVQLGRIALATEEWAVAVRHLSFALAQRPELAEAARLLGHAYTGQGEWRRAADAFAQTAALLHDGASLSDLAIAQFRAGDAGAAEATLRRAAAADPQSADIHLNHGHVLLGLGRTAEAVRAYRNALDRRPDDAGVGLALAWVLATTGDAAVRDGREALAVIEHSVAPERRHGPEVQRALAAAYAELGRYDEATAAARVARTNALDRQDLELVNVLDWELAEFAAHRPVRKRPPTP